QFGIEGADLLDADQAHPERAAECLLQCIDRGAGRGPDLDRIAALAGGPTLERLAGPFDEHADMDLIVALLDALDAIEAYAFSLQHGRADDALDRNGGGPGFGEGLASGGLDDVATSIG